MNCESGKDQGSECLSPLGPLASMADVSAAGIELPNGVTVAISSPMFLYAIYM